MNSAPAGWNATTIGDAFQILRGRCPQPIDPYLTDGPAGVPRIQIQDAPPGAKYIRATKQKITPELAQKSRQVKPGDLVLTVCMSYGRAYIVGIRGCIHEGWVALRRRRKKSDPEFLFYALRSPDVVRQFESKASGGFVKNLKSGDLHQIRFPLPPLPEQKRIAGMLSSIDSSVHESQAVITQALRVKQGLLASLLTPGEGWHREPLGNLARVCAAKLAPGSSRPYIAQEHIEKGTGRVIAQGRPADVVGALYDCLPGDVIFSPLLPSLRKYWHASYPAAASSSLLILRPKSDLFAARGISREYLYAIVQSDPFLRHAHDAGTGTLLPRAAWSSLAKYLAPVPPPAEERRIIDTLGDVDRCIAGKHAAIAQAELLKRGLLDGLMKGTVRIKK